MQGLSAEEALRGLARYGSNALQEKKKKTPLMMLGDQFKDFMILVLIAAAVISGIIGDLTDTIAIVVIVVLNAVIGFIQEYRAEAAMAALKKMAAATATVMRNGAPATVNGADLVPGDVVLLEAGRIAPADMRCIETVQMKVEEAALTGESVPVEKHTDPLADETLPLGDRKNMVYKGTFVTYGRGSGMVVATGMDTELGKIASMLQEEEEVKTPLQKRLAAFGRKLSIAVLAICAFVFAVGMMRGEPPLLMLLTAISLAVAAIPEALPAVITISLALGAKKLVKQNALIRKLPAVETLGSVTYICTDKTGTLTLNKMTVEEVYCDGTLFRAAEMAAFNNKDHLLMVALALNNDAQTGTDGVVLGDPTEIALYDIARKQGCVKEELEKKYPRVAEIPFDSDRKCMTTMHAWDKGFVSFTKGAIEDLLDKSDAIVTSEGLQPVHSDEIRTIHERMAADGLRVLGVAMRTWDALPDDLSPGQVETGLTLLGLAGMMDPPREEAGEAVSMCKAAGIKPAMLTTVEYRVGEDSEAAVRTTPEASDTNRFLRRAVEANCGFAAMEASSQAIDLHQRAEKLEVKVGAIVLCPGYDAFDPRARGDYGYGTIQNVVTSGGCPPAVCDALRWVLGLIPAEEAGILAGDQALTTPGHGSLYAGGDLIIAADGEEVRLFDDLLGYLVLHKRPGETITLTIIREGEEMEVEVTLGTRP